VLYRTFEAVREGYTRFLLTGCCLVDRETHVIVDWAVIEQEMRVLATN
jgi:hypothetical protein